MKHNVIILIGIVIFINSCRMPVDPQGIDIIQHIGPIRTVGKCLDIDVNDTLVLSLNKYTPDKLPSFIRTPSPPKYSPMILP